MSETIEEAWADLETLCGRRMKLDKPAARALALAVLGEAMTHLSLHAEHGAYYEALRARIEALGR